MNYYIHIPFCHSKCAYCAFLSHCDQSKEDEYVTALCNEIAKSPHLSSRATSRDLGKISPFVSLSRNDSPKDTIYFGGGTPSLIEASNIKKMIQTLRTRTKFTKDTEVTLESNPEDITEAKLAAWKQTGVNRLSIGIQSLNDTTRKAINRSLLASEALQKVVLAKKYFDNVGVDLISGLPHETMTTQLDTLRKLAALGVNHISLYDLETDNTSAIGKHPERFALPAEDTATTMLLSAWKLLTELGFEQYEISNFTRKQEYCRHNLDFWHGKDYLGFGLGATSRQKNVISTNTDNFVSYLQGDPKPSRTILSENEQYRLKLLATMRLNASFRQALMQYKGNVTIPSELLSAKLVTREYRLTLAGKLVYNQVVNRFI